MITLGDGPRIDRHCVAVNKVKVRAVFNPLKQGGCLPAGKRDSSPYAAAVE